MSDDPSSASENSSPLPGDAIKESIAQAQHDLRNPLGNVLCFCEWLLPQLPQSGADDLRAGLNSIYQTTDQMLRDINEVLDPDKPPPEAQAVKSLQERLRPRVGQNQVAIQSLRLKAAASTNPSFCEDLARMDDSAQRIGKLIDSALSFYEPTAKL